MATTFKTQTTLEGETMTTTGRKINRTCPPELSGLFDREQDLDIAQAGIEKKHPGCRVQRLSRDCNKYSVQVFDTDGTLVADYNI